MANSCVLVRYKPLFTLLKLSGYCTKRTSTTLFYPQNVPMGFDDSHVNSHHFPRHHDAIGPSIGEAECVP
jgi:hypothetical protein